MAPVANRLTMSTAGSTSDKSTGSRPMSAALRMRNSPRKRHELLVLVVDLLGEAAIPLQRITAHRVLKVADHVGPPDMGLAARPEGVFATRFERVPQHGRVAERQPVALDRLGRDFRQAHAFDPRMGAGEVPGDEVGLQAHCVENLGAAVGLIGGDAHLGHHLEQPLVHRLDEALGGLVGANVFVHLGDLVAGWSRKREIRVDRLGAIARERAELMHFVGFAGLDHESDGGAQPLADQVMMHGRHRQQRRDGDAAGRNGAVRQDDDVGAVAQSRLGVLAEAVDGALHARGAEIGGIGDVKRRAAEGRVAVAVQRADAVEHIVAQDGLRHFKTLQLRASAEIQEVRPGSNERHQRHDQLFADRIDGRIGDLGEVLLEIGVEQLGLAGQRRHRRVVAHGADRLLAGQGHGRDEEFPALLGVAERLLAIQQRRVGQRTLMRRGRQVLDLDLTGGQPLLIGMGVGQLGLDLVVGNDAALLQVDEQHPARLEPPLVQDLLLGHGQHARTPKPG